MNLNMNFNVSGGLAVNLLHAVNFELEIIRQR